MTGLQYENFVAEYLESCNYTSVEVTKGSGDFGVDVTAYNQGINTQYNASIIQMPLALMLFNKL